MDEQERAELAEELMRRLAAEGVPEGSWLVDVAQARRALAQLDDLLDRLERALTDAASGPGLTLGAGLVYWIG